MKIYFTKTLLLIAVIALITGCGGSKSAVDENVKPTGKHFLWKAASGKGTIYILGTSGLEKSSTYPMPQIIEDAFNQSDVLVLSEDRKGLTQNDYKKVFIYEWPNSLDKSLKKETFGRVKAYLTSYGAPESEITKMTPLYVTNNIIGLEYDKALIGNDHSPDKYFHDKIGTKDSAYLYPLKDYLKKIDALTNKYPDDYMSYMLNSMEFNLKNADKINEAWKNGDIETFDKLSNKYKDDYPNLKAEADKMETELKAKIMTRLEEFLGTEKVYFIVTDSDKLIGPNGLIKMLEAKGIKVEWL